MRAYIYQARSLIAADTETSASGYFKNIIHLFLYNSYENIYFSDPYCLLAFANQSMKTEIKYKTLSPVWDQTLIFESIELYGNILEIENYAPIITIELFDKDNSVIFLNIFS